MTHSATPDADALARELERVRALVRHVVRDGAVADDLTQEAWLTAARRGAPAGASPVAWLTGIARNLARRVARAEERRTRHERLVAPPGAAPATADVVARAELCRRVVDAVLALDEPYRTALLARYFDGLSSAEIARRTGVPAATVRSRVMRGVELLRERFRGERSEDRPSAALLLLLADGPRPSALGPLAGGLAMKSTTKAVLAAAALFLVAAVVAVATRDRSAVTAPLSSAAVPGDTPAAATAAPPAPSLVRGLVRNRDDLRPVAGCRVTLRWDTASASVETGPSGEFRIDAAVRRAADVTVSAAGFRSRPPLTVAPRPGETTDVGTIWLVPVRRVAVLVLDRESRPVEGARVEAARARSPPWNPVIQWDFVDAADAPDGSQVVSAVTGADGRVALEDVPDLAVVEASKPGYALVRRSTDQDGTVVLVLGAGHALEGTVFDARGVPVVDASVVATVVHGMSTRSARTDADGRYRLDALPRGDYRIGVARAGAEPGALAQNTLRVPDVARFDLVLRDAALLAGSVTDAATGAPVAGAVIRVTGTCGAARGTSGADGRYAIDSLHEGIVAEFDVVAPGYVLDLGDDASAGVVRFALRGSATTTRDVRLRRGARVEGVVTGPDGPVPGAVVTLIARHGHVWRRAEADDEGRYAFAAVDAGDARIRAERAGWSEPGRRPGDPDAGRIVVPAEGALAVDLKLVPGAAGDVVIEGRVESPGGLPLEGVSVMRPVGATVRTDEGGRFHSVGPAPGGNTLLWFTRDDLETAQLAVGGAEDGLRGLLVHLGRTRHVSGTLRAADGSEVRDAEVEVLAFPPRSSPGAQQDTVLASRVLLSADGRFDAVLPWSGEGTFRVRAWAAGGLEGMTADLPLAVGRDEYAADIVLDGPVTVSGRVVDARTGAGIAGAAVVDSTGAFVAVSGADGSFSARVRPSASDGAARVAALARDYVPSDWPTVTREQRTSVRIELEPALAIEGVVRYPDGSPAASVGVAADREFATYVPGPLDQGITDAEGRFRVPALQRGMHALHVSPLQGVASDLRAFVTEPIEAGRTGLVLVARRGVAISGRVTDVSGRPLAGIRVTATRDRGEWSVLTSSDGRFRIAGLDDGAYDVEAAQQPYPNVVPLAPARRPGVPTGTDDVEFVLR